MDGAALMVLILKGLQQIKPMNSSAKYTLLNIQIKQISHSEEVLPPNFISKALLTCM